MDLLEDAKVVIATNVVEVTTSQDKSKKVEENSLCDGRKGGKRIKFSLIFSCR
jgi:hypothetical protein